MSVDDLLGTAPADDAGSETLARYDFQISLTAVACLRMLVDDSVLEVVCEWVEDYIVRTAAGLELVSVKHLEPSVGPWTLTAILDSGGISHLFRRWRDAAGEPRCRLQTNGGLKTGAKGAEQLRAACRGEKVEEVAALIQNDIGATSVDEAAAFIRCLTIEAELPKRDDLTAKLVGEVLPRDLRPLGWSGDELVERFQAVRTIVARAARSDIRSEGRTLSVTPEEIKAEARARARKTISRDQVQAACASVQRSPTRLVQKLERGGLGPTDVEMCRTQRADWLAEEQRWDTDLPGPEPFEGIRLRVRQMAIEAEHETRVKGSAYAASMRTRLTEMFETAPPEVPGMALTPQLLLGVVYDETDRCRVWWSDRFETDGSAR